MWAIIQEALLPETSDHMILLCISVTEDESMKLLVQNVQNLSNAVQRLLEAAESTSLDRHVKSAQEGHLSWKRVRESRSSTIPSRRKELEESGKCNSMNK